MVTDVMLIIRTIGSSLENGNKPKLQEGVEALHKSLTERKHQMYV